MKTIDNLLIRLQEVSGMPNLNLDHNSVYGGYRLGYKNNGNGAFGENGCEARLSNKDMCLKLRSLIAGIEFGRNNPKIK